MRRILLVATMASVALASCVKDESVDLTQQAKKLSFEAPVMGTQSRAIVKGEISGSTYPETEMFVVFAKQSKGDLTAWENGEEFWGTGLEYITVQKGDDGWEHETNDYYWPKTTDDAWKLSFNAYSPAENGSASVTCTNVGLTITDFVVNSTVNQQVDLMYSGPILNRTEEQDGTNGVQVVFKHALSSVVFAAVENDDAASYTINTIKVYDLSYDKGTFCENLTNGITVGTPPSWENPSKNGTEVSYSPTVLTTAVPVATATDPAPEITNGTSAILAIPQALTDAKVEINYTVTPTNGVETTYKKTIKLTDFTKNNGTQILSWDMATRYTYVIKFKGTQKIFFVPKVTDWTNADAVYYEI